MSSLDTLIQQSGGKASSGGSSLDSLLANSKTPTAENAQFKTARIKTEATASKAAATKANSVAGILKAAIAAAPQASGIPQAASSSFKSAVESYTAASQPGQTLPQFGENILKTGAGVAGVFFSPLAPLNNQTGKLITAAGNQAAKLPPIASYGKAVANIPDYQPENETATRVLSALSNAGVIAQGLLGAKVGEAEVPTRLKVSGTSEETPIPIRAVTKVPVKGVSKETPVNVYRAPTPENELPTIQMGKPAADRSGLPTIQAGPSTRSVRTQSGDVSFEPIPSNPRAIYEPTAPARETAVATAERPTPVATAIKGGTRPTAAANDIASALVQRGFDELPPEEQARYTPSTKAAQLTKVADLMRDTEQATRIAKGEAPLPPDIHAPVFFNAMEKYAHDTNNFPLLKEMAKSPLAERTSSAGQELGSAGFNKNDYGPVKIIRRIEKVRQSSARVVRQTRDTVVRAKQVIRKANTRESWSDFVKSIEC